MEKIISNINGMADRLREVPPNDYDNPYHIALNGLNLETDLMINTDPLRKLFDALHGKYIILDLRGCTGQFLPGADSETIVNGRPYKEYIVSVLLPDSITSIGEYTFAFCSSLTAVSLPSSLNIIKYNAFGYCRNLRSVILPASLPLSTFEENPFNHGDWYIRFHSLAFTVIGNGPFRTINEGRILIHNTTIVSAHGLNDTVILPGGITAINSLAFLNCDALNAVSLPESITAIGPDAFTGCNNLRSVNCGAPSPPSADNSIFYDTHPTLTITVPAAGVNAYKAAAGWNAYADKISAHDMSK